MRSQGELHVFACKIRPQLHQGHRQVNEIGRCQDHGSLHTKAQHDQADMQGLSCWATVCELDNPGNGSSSCFRPLPQPPGSNWGSRADRRVLWSEQVNHESRLRSHTQGPPLIRVGFPQDSDWTTRLAVGGFSSSSSRFSPLRLPLRGVLGGWGTAKGIRYAHSSPGSAPLPQTPPSELFLGTPRRRTTLGLPLSSDPCQSSRPETRGSPAGTGETLRLPALYWLSGPREHERRPLSYTSR